MSAIEDLDPDESDRLERLLLRPLKINCITESSLKSSGLFTDYQLASFIDYRTRHGDVLSFTELAAIEGFGESFVRDLSPFISLQSLRLPGEKLADRKGAVNEIHIRSGFKKSQDPSYTYSLKYSIEADDCIQAGLAVSKMTDDAFPQTVSCHFAWTSRKLPLKIVAGDFNARFGQGLGLWSGVSLSSVSRPSGYLKKSTNISSSGSYNPDYSLRGLAAELRSGRFDLSVFTAFGKDKDKYDFLPGMNMSWRWHYGRAGITHYGYVGNPESDNVKTSLDLCMNIRGVDVFAESSYDWRSGSLASLAGSVFPAGEGLNLAIMLRHYPSDYDSTLSAAKSSSAKCSNETAVSFSGEYICGQWIKVKGRDGFGASERRFNSNLSIDAVYFPLSKDVDVNRSFQLKSLAEMKLMISSAFSLSLRLSERIRTWDMPFKTELRVDLSYFSDRITASFRFNVLKCVNYSFLSYLEAGLLRKSVNMYLRQGCFMIDDWDDRIYAYERDIPGSFNVPAFYGRGVWTSLTASWKLSRFLRIYFRTSFTAFPFMEIKKPGRAELRFMMKFSI